MATEHGLPDEMHPNLDRSIDLEAARVDGLAASDVPDDAFTRHTWVPSASATRRHPGAAVLTIAT